MGGSGLSWFELKAEELEYSNLMGAWRSADLNQDGFFYSSLSDVHWVFYLLFVVLSVFVGYRLLLLAAKLSDKRASYCRVALVLLAVLFLYSCYLVMLLWNMPLIVLPEKIREGGFGDSFGTVNALFSGLAFSGVLITLLFQRKDLSETRAQIISQQIESQFYNMLNQQQEVVRNFDLQNLRTNEVIARGRDCFRDWTEALTQIHKVLSDASGGKDVRDESYNFVFITYRSDLGLYFRSLYSVFRFIDSCGHKDARDFGLVLRSLLSDYELVIIFYNCLSPRGEKFSRYVYSFGLFDNLDPELLLSREHINLFTYEAYGSNRTLVEQLKAGPPSK